MQIRSTTSDGKHIRVLYEDGNTEDMSQEQFNELHEEGSIEIGYVGYQFIKRFGRAGYFDGKVIGVCPNDKRLCEFSNGAHPTLVHSEKVYVISLLKIERSKNRTTQFD